MLGEFPREEEPDSSLDLAGSDGGPLVVVGEARRLGSESLEDVVDERVHTWPWRTRRCRGEPA